MKNLKFKIQKALILTLVVSLLALTGSCGYRLIGSSPLPFNSITIKPVRNDTYEPKLEDRMHAALSNEFITQGIEVKAAGGEVYLETAIKTFALGAIAAVDEAVMEQEIVMYVDLKLVSNGKVSEFKSMSSPIRITFQSTGTVGQSVAFKERASDKACREIAKEMVGKIIMEYAK